MKTSHIFFILIGFFTLTGVLLSGLIWSGSFAWIIIVFLSFAVLFFLPWPYRIFFIILFAHTVSNTGTLVLWQAFFLFGCGMLITDIISQIAFKRHAPAADAISITLAVIATGIIFAIGSKEILSVLCLGLALFIILTIISNYSKYGSVM